MPHERDEHEAGRDRRHERPEEHALSQPKARALSREEIEKSADLQRRYMQEYGSMLRVVSDRKVAKEGARVNVREGRCRGRGTAACPPVLSHRR